MEITIQRDGRIAIQEHNEALRYADPTDPTAILPLLRAATTFEDGLTLRQLVMAISPWKALLGRAAWMNFDAWLQELDKTHLVEATSEDPEDKLACVEIFCVLNVYRSDEGFLCVDGHWDFHGRHPEPVDYDGHLYETTGLTFAEPKTYANLPIKICRTASVHDHDVGPPIGRRPILSSSSPGVYTHVELTPTFFDTVVLGLLDKISFHGSPEATAEVGSNIATMVEQIRAHEHQLGEVDQFADVDDPRVTSNGAGEVPATTDEAGSIFKTLDIDFDEERSDATFELWRAIKHVQLPDPILADKLDLSDIGVLELQQGTTAHFSLKKLKQLTGIIRDHVANAAAEK